MLKAAAASGTRRVERRVTHRARREEEGKDFAPIAAESVNCRLACIARDRAVNLLVRVAARVEELAEEGEHDLELREEEDAVPLGFELR